jgi:hypothetical protein
MRSRIIVFGMNFSIQSRIVLAVCICHGCSLACGSVLLKATLESGLHCRTALKMIRIAQIVRHGGPRATNAEAPTLLPNTADVVIRVKATRPSLVLAPGF